MESQNILIKNATILNPLGNGKTEEKNADVLIHPFYCLPNIRI